MKSSFLLTFGSSAIVLLLTLRILFSEQQQEFLWYFMEHTGRSSPSWEREATKSGGAVTATVAVAVAGVALGRNQSDEMNSSKQEKIITTPNDGNFPVEGEEPGVNSVERTLPPAVFYNLYIPTDALERTKHIYRDRVYEIVKEQFKQLARSYAATSLASSNNNTFMEVYYTTIGRPVNDSFVTRVCGDNKLDCQHNGHHRQGYEMFTQQKIIEYCEKNPSRRVIYLHPKGSFHQYMHFSQDEWRRNLTDAATSKNCTDPPDSRCNVCGLAFQPTWGPIYMGTMFQAKCSYLSKLLSPIKVERTMKDAYDARPENLTDNLYPYMPYTSGGDRYAAEIFVGTHPHLMACDATGQLSPRSPWPAHEGSPGLNLDLQRSYINATTPHDREWFLLGGLLWKYHFMYNTTPPDDSWVWWYFPDGRKWQRAVQKFGMPLALNQANFDSA